MVKKLIGTIGVDSGLVYIVDPCYIKHHPNLSDPELWDDFCRAYYPEGNKSPNYKEINHGVAVNTLFGDGSYGVYAHFDKEGSVRKVEIDFTKMVN